VVERVVDTLGIEKGDVTVDLDDSKLSGRFSPSEVNGLQATVDGLSAAERDRLGDMLEAEGQIMVDGRLITEDEVLVSFENTVSDTLNQVAGASAPFTIFSLIFSAWSASAMFGAVRKALNIIWQSDVRRAYFQQKLFDLFLVLAFGLMLLASVIGTGALRGLREASDTALGPLSSGTGIFWGVLPYVLPGVVSFVVFGALYRFIPAAAVRFKDVWLGALIAALLFEVMKNAFAFYVANFEAYDLLYGSLGGILLFLTGVYLGSSILLLGGEFAHAMPGLRAGAFAGRRDPNKPKETLLQELRREAGNAVRSIIWYPRRREGEGDPRRPANRP
jgi:membrane protein